MHVYCTDESRRICEETASVLRSQGQSAEAVAVTFVDNLLHEFDLLLDDGGKSFPAEEQHCVLVL